MLVALTELKLNVGKYVEMAEIEEVTITKYGRPIAKIVRFDSIPWYQRKLPEEITSIEQLFGTLPSDVDLDELRSERLLK